MKHDEHVIDGLVLAHKTTDLSFPPAMGKAAPHLRSHNPVHRSHGSTIGPQEATR